MTKTFKNHQLAVRHYADKTLKEVQLNRKAILAQIEDIFHQDEKKKGMCNTLY